MQILFTIFVLLGVSCGQSQRESSLPEKYQNNSIAQEKFIIKIDTILTDSFFIYNVAKNMRLYNYTIKDDISSKKEDFCKILFFRENKLVSIKDYIYIPISYGFYVFINIDKKRFKSIGSDRYTTPHTDMYFIVDWNDFTIKIEKIDYIDYDIYGKEEKETTLIDKTIDEYEAELKAEYGK